MPSAAFCDNKCSDESSADTEKSCHPTANHDTPHAFWSNFVLVPQFEACAVFSNPRNQGNSAGAVFPLDGLSAHPVQC